MIPLFVKNLRDSRSPTIFGSGEQTRDFTFVSDCVAANLAAAQAEGVVGEVFNVLADVAKSEKFLKWQARIDIAEGLAKTLG